MTRSRRKAQTGAAAAATSENKFHVPDRMFAVELGPFFGQVYSPTLHNQMVSALKAQGIDGDHDALVQAFANVDDNHAATVLARAKKLRGE